METSEEAAVIIQVRVNKGTKVLMTEIKRPDVRKTAAVLKRKKFS